MEARGRARFNRCRFDKRQADESCSLWMAEDYALLETEILYQRLKAFGITGKIEELSKQANDPEELAQKLSGSEDLEKIYLLIFELWRRFLPEKETLSIFADSLDELIDRFEEQDLSEEEEDLLICRLKSLENLLDDYVSRGWDKETAFEFVASYFCYDLEQFIYSFILDQISFGNDTLASELILGIYPYIKEKSGFDFLKIQILYNVDPQRALSMLDELVEEGDECENPDLWLDVIAFLAAHGDHQRLKAAYQKTVHHLEHEIDLREMLSILADYYDLIGNSSQKQTVLKIAQSRSELPPEAHLDLSYHEKLMLQELI